MKRQGMKVVSYKDICKVRDFKDFKMGILPENTLYIVKKAEKTQVIPPANPFPGIHLPNECITEDFYLACLKDAICLKNQTILYNNRILPDSFRHYEYNAPTRNLQFNERLNQFTLKVNHVKPIYLKGNYIYLSGEISRGFGHFLLEVVSRLWITNFMDISKVKFIMNPEDKESWQLEILKAIGINKKQIVYLHNPVRCERLYIPVQSFALRKYTSTFALQTWKRIGDFYDRGSGFEKIYVSRSKLRNNRRNLINEKAVERIFSQNGFKIIHPQEMKMAEQINLFRNAKVIAGPSGSAMYNSVFRKKQARIIVLASQKFFKMSDILINSSVGGKLDYFIGKTADKMTPGIKADWKINTNQLNQFLRNI
ncbi:glycosyltransferase family 61 protein [Cytobacillus sp. NCCP-133]|uniref:glycosyltransferase family 61 protein n=1 Tax=Cytobacillus sp. NCCP-133 TaxID=766848 RepID=UPI00222E5FE1|nr:glycosyltransferase 61 family protein [Cytobacillus sp. NCCP-133]GLB62016.1 hypothetical protein NCCP133_41450 [Cytobacillus sp. NCCP-133]